MTHLLLLLLLSHFNHVQSLCDPTDGSPPGSTIPGILRQEHWSGLPLPSPLRESESQVAQSRLTRSDPMECSPPVSSIHGIFQARVLEWLAIAFSAYTHYYIYIYIYIYIYNRYLMRAYCIAQVAWGKESAWQCRTHRRCEFSPRTGKICWRRKWKPTPVFLPGMARGAWRATIHRSLRELDTTEHAHTLIPCGTPLSALLWLHGKEV